MVYWNFGGEIVTDRMTCCGGNLSMKNGRRLAIWRRGPSLNIICSNQLPALMVSLIITMVVARLFDPGTSEG
jgi:hypothetical protein